MEMLGQLLPFVFLIAIMYFVIIRPQQQEMRRKKEMIESLKKGDKIVTSGGFIADVYKVEEKFLKVKLNDDTIVRLEKDFVLRKFGDEA
ncbi:Preprotein translocase subunit YajC (TC 3.A.5.1.1) [hydrothermal vent metagenome]|uniref:Preprotein translocase subunit YajC (TC 3.A.5.1.1) n=1 Tax=hydrothermal vent metagenome TaxID=652676 RepID=A0A1W1BY20_9ZZZZ